MGEAPDTATLRSNVDHWKEMKEKDYFKTLGNKLSAAGIFVVQFLEDLEPGAANQDAELRVYEPSVTWTIAQLYKLSAQSGLKFREVRTIQVTPTALWHWACFGRA